MPIGPIFQAGDGFGKIVGLFDGFDAIFPCHGNVGGRLMGVASWAGLELTTFYMELTAILNYPPICWSDARAVWNFWISQARRVNKTEDLFLHDSYLIPCKPYPKGLPPPVLERAALATAWDFY